MKLMKQEKLGYNLQFFAEGGDGDGTVETGEDGDDDQDNDQDSGESDDKKSGKAAKMYTQEEIDEMITKRLERERKKQERKQQSKDNKEQDKDKSTATDNKVSALEAKLLCYEHDVAKDSVADVVALAKSYVDDDTDFEEAIEKVIKKYPQFVKSSFSKKEELGNGEDEEEDDEPKKAWGKRQKKEQKKEKSLDDEIGEQMFGKKKG